MPFTINAKLDITAFIAILKKYNTLPKIRRNEKGWYALCEDGGLEYLSRTHFTLDELVKVLNVHGVNIATLFVGDAT